MIRQLLLVVLIATSVLSQDGSLDDLIKQLFTTPPPGTDNVVPTQRPGPGPGPAPGPGPVPTQKPVQPVLPPGIPEHDDCHGGECVPYYLCVNNSLITDGEGLIDIRFNEDEPKQCHNYLETCCSEADVKENPTLPDIEKVEGCGHRHSEGIGFKITDKDSESQYGEFPWMVAVLKEERAAEQTLNVYQCGGALIHPQVVLTAAHCVSGKTPNQLKVRAGEWDTQTKNELWPHQDRDVSEIVIHEQYYKGALYNDIALLFMNHAVELAENVQTICLPPQDVILDGTRCVASGWGKDVYGREGKYQVILKKIELPIVPRPTCLKALRTTRLGKRFELHNSFICAGGESGRDTCKGDGGSPLVCPIPGHPNRYYQGGIVAWGIGCGENQVPGVYVNIPLFRTWIDQQFHNKGLDSSYYTL